MADPDLQMGGGEGGGGGRPKKKVGSAIAEERGQSFLKLQPRV